MLCKLLKPDLTTHNGFQWEVGKTYTIDKTGNRLCTDEVFHAYHSPETAALFNKRHGNIQNPVCYSVETTEIVSDDGMKVGVKSLTLIETIDFPVFSSRQRTIFAILCAKSVSNKLISPIYVWDTWANKYLRGADTTASAAEADAYAAAYAASTYDAEAAAYAATAATYAATYADADAAAAYAATYAAASAEAAADDAAINFTALARQALTWDKDHADI